MTTGERIKARRREIGMSAESVAARMGISPATVYRWENGYIEKVGGDQLNKLAEILLTTPHYLMGWTDDAQCVVPSETSTQAAAITAQTRDEERLLVIMRQLNPNGQARLIEQAEFFAGKDEYKNFYPTAANGGSQVV